MSFIRCFLLGAVLIFSQPAAYAVSTSEMSPGLSPEMPLESRLRVTPAKPIDCDLRDYEKVNHVFGIEKVLETEDEVIFRLLSQYGHCEARFFHAHPVRAKYVYVAAMQSGPNFFRKQPVDSVHFEFDLVTIEVVLTFDKKRLFKKENFRRLYMEYHPLGAFNEYYRWYLDLILTERDETELKLTTQPRD